MNKLPKKRAGGGSNLDTAPKNGCFFQGGLPLGWYAELELFGLSSCPNWAKDQWTLCLCGKQSGTEGWTKRR